MQPEPPPGGGEQPQPTPPGTPYPPYSPYPSYPNPGGYQQPYYQQPYYQQPNPGPMPPPPSVVGDSGAVIAGLGYLFFLVGLIMFFAEQRNRFVKFHAAQSLLIHLGAIVASIAWAVILVVLVVVAAGLGAASGAAGNASGNVAAASLGIFFVIALLLGVVLAILYIVALIWGMVAAFSGRYTKLPVVGNLAERWAGGPVPAGPIRPPYSA